MPRKDSLTDGARSRRNSLRYSWKRRSRGAVVYPYEMFRPTSQGLRLEFSNCLAFLESDIAKGNDPNWRWNVPLFIAIAAVVASSLLIYVPGPLAGLGLGAFCMTTAG